jgi:PIN domain nuclease of toxin-antitoxin system
MEAIMIHLDTHVVVWLYAGMLEKIPAPVRVKLEQNTLAISPMVVLELQYLYEIKRMVRKAWSVVNDLSQQIGLTLAETPFLKVVQAATEIHWTRDPFDRMIVGQAMVENVALITADRIIKRHFSQTFWD